MALEATFKQTAESFSKEINQTLTNDDLKEVYGLYKQVLRANIWEIINARKDKENTFTAMAPI